MINEQKSTEKLVKEMIDYINEGFNKMGRVINNATVLDKYLIASTLKAVRFSNAILLLCHTGFTDESLSILRSLIEHSINIRWIMHKDTKIRLKSYMDDLGKKGFGTRWSEKDFFSRMQELGFGRDYYDFCVKPTYSYSHVNSSSLIWAEVYDDSRLSKERFSPDAIFQVVAQMLGHVIKSLDIQFKGYFSDYNNFWSQIKVDKNIRKKINKVLESFK